MKQIFQDLRTGAITMANLAVPTPGRNDVVIQTRASIVSPGTERMLAQFALANPLQKALLQPERVRQVINKIRTDGLRPTLAAVSSKLSTPMAVGYSSAGIVIEVGKDVTAFRVGDRVVCNGPHAEVVCVPTNLCARIPDNVSFESAAFTTLGAISLQGIRLIDPTLGETIAVQGLGLLGLIACQILKANGCQALGFDLDADRVALAKQLGIDAHLVSESSSCVETIMAATSGRGADAVLISATSKSDAILHEAAVSCRKHGRIVLIGAIGPNLDRRDFYEKEITFQVSCSYGPGRYDPLYESKGCDYPLAFVRWTAQRNFEAILALLSSGSLRTEPLLSAKVEFSVADTEYQKLLMSVGSLGIAFTYPSAPVSPRQPIQLRTRESKAQSLSRPRIGLIGAGQFSTSVLCPSLSKLPAALSFLCSSRGSEASSLGARFGFESLCSDSQTVIQSPLVDCVFIATRHNSHAYLAQAALQAGKHVFVEKPLALSREELREVMTAARKSTGALLMVGYNRRFAPLAVKARELLAHSQEPRAITITVNAGAIDSKHWIHDPLVGGGRLLGEGCHFIDLAMFLANAPALSVQTVATRGGSAEGLGDIFSTNLQFANGSIASVHYYSNGSKILPKEKVEIFCSGRVVQIENFRELHAFGFKSPVRVKLSSQDKGHHAGISQFISALTAGAASPISLDDIEASTAATLAAQSSLQTGETIKIRDFLSDQPPLPSGLTITGESSVTSGASGSLLAKDEIPEAVLPGLAGEQQRPTHS
jgi:predicted dehydrogenase/threonine dehydrogenase-like Zn-dependent dehydrogenase